MFKLVLEKSEEPEIKLPASTGSWKKQESSRKTSTSALLTKSKPLLCGSQQIRKFFKRREYQTIWPASWEIYMQVRKHQLELDMEQQTGSKLGKEYIKAVSLPCLFSLYAKYIRKNVGMDEAQAGIKIAGRNINNLWYADDTILMAESKEELKPPDESERRVKNFA